MKKVSFVTTSPDISINTWSGTEYYMSKTLEKHFDVSYITNLKMNLFTKASLRKLFNKSYSLTRSPEVAKDYSKQVLKRLPQNIDIIFSAGTIPIAHIDTNKPKVFFTDATFAQMINYYEEASGLAARTIKDGMALEQQALDSAALALYCSEWAANSAINDYNISPEKVRVVPLGANIDRILDLEDVRQLIARRNNKVCKILFLGVDWVRKRGDLVVETVKLLNEELSMPTELHVVGIRNLPSFDLPPYVINHGFISKSEPGGIEKIENIISESHFLFVPSKMEAYGLVFCEAMSVGVPAITSKTGGIPTIVKNDINGVILDINASAMEYAENIYKIFTNQSLYKELSISAYADFKERLNWNVAGKNMAKYINEL